MGELNANPFIVATKRRLSQDNALKMVSLWDDHLRDPNWHPFKVITSRGGKQGILGSSLSSAILTIDSGKLSGFCHNIRRLLLSRLHS